MSQKPAAPAEAAPAPKKGIRWPKGGAGLVAAGKLASNVMRYVSNPLLALVGDLPGMEGFRKLHGYAAVIGIVVMSLSTVSGIPAGLMPATMTAFKSLAVDSFNIVGELLQRDWGQAWEKTNDLLVRQMNHIGRFFTWVGEGMPEAGRKLSKLFENIFRGVAEGADTVGRVIDGSLAPEKVPDLPMDNHTTLDTGGIDVKKEWGKMGNVSMDSMQHTSSVAATVGNTTVYGTSFDHNALAQAQQLKEMQLAR